VDPSRWERAGLYDPARPDAAERLELLEHLAERGASLDEMVDAARLGGLAELAGRLLRRRGAGTVPVEVLADRHGTTVDTVRRILLAAGLPASAGTDVPAELEVLVSAFVHGVALMGEEPLLAFTRVLGAAAINIAEAAVALFYAELGPGSERDPGSELGRARMSERATLAFSVVPEAFSRLLEVQFERAIERAAAARGLGSADPDAERVALGFVDLVGSTEWASRLDLREQSLALSRFEATAWSSAVLAGGRVVKMVGDEAFFAAPSVDAACRIATEVIAWVAADPVLPSARGAVGVGSASSREGDYFGPVVNLVSRLVKAARPGSVLLTADAAAEIEDPELDLRPVGPVAVRGVAEPVPAFALEVREGT